MTLYTILIVIKFMYTVQKSCGDATLINFGHTEQKI